LKKYLKELPSDDTPKIYFSGEYESNQTKFEKGSNNLKFGVLSTNKTVALVLLRFLRIIIDNRPEFLVEDSFSSWVDEYDSENDCMNGFVKYDKELEINKIIKRLSKQEKSYMNCYLLDKPISSNFVQSEFNFTKHIEEIDIWTLPRIMQEMRDLY
jgi:hypothetical protein